MHFIISSILHSALLIYFYPVEVDWLPAHLVIPIMTDTLILTLNQIMNEITFYGPCFTIILGVFGNLCNILTFSAKKLRQNPSGFYLLCSSIFDLFIILFCTVAEFTVIHYKYGLIDYYPTFCKIYVYLIVTLPGLSICSVMLASIDRCLLSSSSAKWRSWSKIKVAYRIILIGSLIWIFSTSHILIFYGINTLRGMPNKCSAQPGPYAIFVSAFYIIYLTIIPYTIMLISNLMTFYNIRTSRKRVGALQQLQQQQILRGHGVRRSIDRNLIFMILIQVILSMILLSTRSGYIAYQQITRSAARDARRYAIETFVLNLTTVIYYINYAKSFFLYTLTSGLFREIFWKRFQKLCKYVHHHIWVQYNCFIVVGFLVYFFFNHNA